MKNNLTELVFILDKSGSMAHLVGDTVGGFNGMVEKQKRVDGECLVTTVLFSDGSRIIHDRKRLCDIAPLTEQDYAVGGGTALLDAIGDTIRHIGEIHKYARPEDVPAHTMVVITTDGMENQSRKYTYSGIKKLVEQKKEQGWEFVFLGANMDAISAAESIGISADRAANFHADSFGVAAMDDDICDLISLLRGDGTVDSGWKKNTEADYRNRKK